MFRSAKLSILLLFVAACNTTASLESLREAKVSGSLYHQALSKHYREFAEQELNAYDWWSSKYFADKGLMVTYGQEVEPELIKNWRVSDHDLAEITSARETLVSKLTSAYKQSHPDKAAALLFNFDCWLEEEDEGWNKDAIDHCKNRFYQLLDETDPPVVAQGGPFATSYLLHFPWDSDEVAGVALEELKEMAQSLKGQTHYRVIINGHADRSGSDEYNMQLSQNRADFIRKHLQHNGVPSSRMDYFAFGESDPIIVTDDGVQESANRRVEIFIE